MATIKKVGARKALDEGKPSIGIRNFIEDGGLRFVLTIGSHTVSLTHCERDDVIESWAKMEKDFEKGGV